MRALSGQLSGKTAKRLVYRAMRTWKQQLAARQKRAWETMVENHAKTQVEMLAGHAAQSEAWEQQLSVRLLSLPPAPLLSLSLCLSSLTLTPLPRSFSDQGAPGANKGCRASCTAARAS